jgi:hypothetical protein
VWLFLLVDLVAAVIFVAVWACVLAARANIITTFLDKARHDDFYLY